MKTKIILLTFISFLSSFSILNAQDFLRLFQTEDFTQENLFTSNIEGPCFDSAGNLYVVNFQKDGTIGFVKPDGAVSLFLTLPEGSIANSIVFDSKGTMYLADFAKHNVLKVNMKDKKVRVYVHKKEFNQPNDFCINKNDQLFVSDPNWKESTGKLWRIDKGGKAVLLTEKMGTTNGITLSPDEKTLYVNESVQRKIWKFTVDEKGNISDKTLFAEFPDFGFDGMKCDREGNLYAARYGKGVIVILDPSGKIIREVQLKGKSCSNLVFGGLNGKLVFVTLQDRKGMEKFRNDIPGKGF
ncbi:MAG: SMP-30/gluconolactonase/LRE family protein [Chryseolinea sp.]